MSLEPQQPVASELAEFALFSVLFTEGMQVGVRELVSAWRLPGRALLLGMPLVLVGTAVLAHSVVGLPWGVAFLMALYWRESVDRVRGFAAAGRLQRSSISAGAALELIQVEAY